MSKPRQEFLGPITKLAAINFGNVWISDGYGMVDGYGAKIRDVTVVLNALSIPPTTGAHKGSFWVNDGYNPTTPMFTNSNGNSITLGSVSNGNLNSVYWSNGVSNSWSQNPTIISLTANNNVNIGASVYSPGGILFTPDSIINIKQDTSASDGYAMTIQAQTGASSKNGGDLWLKGGLAGDGGSAGSIRLNVGGFTGMTLATGGGTFGQVNFANGFTVTIGDTADSTALTCNGHVYINNTAEIVGTLRCDNILDVYAGGASPAFEVNSSQVYYLNSVNSESHVLAKAAGFSVFEDGYWGKVITSTVDAQTMNVPLSDGYYSLEVTIISKGQTNGTYYYRGAIKMVGGTVTEINTPTTSNHTNQLFSIAISGTGGHLAIEFDPPGNELTTWIVKAQWIRLP
jgi:hypothetical protein